MPDDISLLKAAVEKSGLSNRRFAQRVLAGRGERTMRYWLSGKEIPAGVLEWLKAYLDGTVAVSGAWLDYDGRFKES